MPTKTKKKERNFVITNYDKNGNVIEDLSKMYISEERQLALLERLNRNRAKVNQRR